MCLCEKCADPALRTRLPIVDHKKVGIGGDDRSIRWGAAACVSAVVRSTIRGDSTWNPFGDFMVCCSFGRAYARNVISVHTVALSALSEADVEPNL